jgi:hypothetical protein
LIHTVTEGNGLPLANRTTAANGNEREQVLPLIDSIKISNGKRGRPRKRLKVIAADKGPVLSKATSRPPIPRDKTTTAKKNLEGKKKKRTTHQNFRTTFSTRAMLWLVSTQI